MSVPTSVTESEHLTLTETAEFLRCSPRTLQRLLETGDGPPVVRLSLRRLIFRVSDVRRWLESRTAGAADVSRPRHRARPPKGRVAEAAS